MTWSFSGDVNLKAARQPVALGTTLWGSKIVGILRAVLGAGGAGGGEDVCQM
jgi:hypothetical protein